MKKFAFVFLASLTMSVGLWAASIAGPAGLYIKVGDSIDRMGDVDTTGKVTGSCFIYDATSGNWEAATCPAGGGGGASTLQVSIGEVQVTSPTVSIDFSSHVFTVTQSPSGESNVGIKGSSVTLMGNTFNVANVLVKLSASALIPNSLIDPSSITKLGGDIALTSETSGNYVASLVAGIGITVGSAGEGATPTVAFSPAALTGSQTFGANNTSGITWCFGIIGTDPCFTFSDDLITVENLTVSDTLTATNATITNLTAGGLNYPTADGGLNQVMRTNGSGTISFATLGTGSSLGVSVGGVIVSSPTSNIDFSSYTFTVSLVGGTTAQIDLNNSSVTLCGQSIDLGTETFGDYVSSITVTAPLLGNTSGHVVLDIDRSSFTLLGPSIDSGELPLHSGAHENGEIDEIDVTGLSGLLADVQTINVSTGGTVVHTSSGINFIPGSNVTIAGAGNGGYTDITISATGDIEGVTAGYGLLGGGTSGTVTLRLKSDSTSYIQNKGTLQAGATMYISSGTVTNLNTTNLTAGNTIQAQGGIFISGVKNKRNKIINHEPYAKWQQYLSSWGAGSTPYFKNIFYSSSASMYVYFGADDINDSEFTGMRIFRLNDSGGKIYFFNHNTQTAIIDETYITLPNDYGLRFVNDYATYVMFKSTSSDISVNQIYRMPAIPGSHGQAFLVRDVNTDGSYDIEVGSVSWTHLADIPAGFADGVDDTSAGGGDNLGDHIATMTITAGYGFTVTTFTATGVSKFADGSYVAPSITFASDPDNGLFHSGGAANKTGYSIGGATAVVFNPGGEINYPLQPAFSVYLTTQPQNVTGSGQSYTVRWGSEITDSGSDISGATFTASVSGNYNLSSFLSYNAVESDVHHITSLIIKTSNREYWLYSDARGYAWATGSVYTMFSTVVAQMEAGDTAVVQAYVGGSGTTIDLLEDRYSSFSGFLAN